jgi:hypothetical protein
LVAGIRGADEGCFNSAGVKHDPGGVDIAPCIDFIGRDKLPGAHMNWCADLRSLRGHPCGGSSLIQCFGDSKVDDFGQGNSIDRCHQNIRPFDVAVVETLLMSMGCGRADKSEQLQPVPKAQLIDITLFCNRIA